mgnify:FL=1
MGKLFIFVRCNSLAERPGRAMSAGLTVQGVIVDIRYCRLQYNIVRGYPPESKDNRVLNTLYEFLPNFRLSQCVIEIPQAPPLGLT